MDREELKIMEGIYGGDNQAYKYIYDHHYVLLCKIAYGFLNDGFLAETIVGDTIFHLYEIREKLQINTSLRSYLIRAVRNRCINYLNQEYKKKELNLSEMPNHENWLYPIADGGQSDLLGLLLEKELEKEIEQAIEKLPEECRRVFKKSRFENKKYKEIADELCISVNTVKYHIKNALAYLGKDLGRHLTFWVFFTLAIQYFKFICILLPAEPF